MSARDVIVISVILLITSVILIVAHSLTNTIMDKAIQTPAFNNSPLAVSSFNKIKEVSNREDYFFFAVFMGLTLGLLVTGWFIGGQPIFMFFYLVFVIVATVISPLFSNMYIGLLSTEGLSASASAFPITTFIMGKLPVFVAVIGLLGLMIMFAKPYFAGNVYEE